jgi:hypothetical protein
VPVVDKVDTDKHQGHANDQKHQDRANEGDVYISIVMAACMDDRRGDSVLRVQNSIDVLVQGFETRKVSIWNLMRCSSSPKLLV